MTDLLQAIISSNRAVSAVPIYEDWVEVDTVSDLESDVTLSRILNIEGEL